MDSSEQRTRRSSPGAAIRRGWGLALCACALSACVPGGGGGQTGPLSAPLGRPRDPAAAAAAAQRARLAEAARLQALGKTAAAEAIYEQLAAAEDSPSTQDQARLELARGAFARGDAARARVLAGAAAQRAGAARGPALELGARLDLAAGQPAACAEQAALAALELEGPAGRGARLLEAECRSRAGQGGAALKALARLETEVTEPGLRSWLHLRAGRIALEELEPAACASLRGKIAGDFAAAYLALCRSREGGDAAQTEALEQWLRGHAALGLAEELRLRRTLQEQRPRPNTVIALLPLSGSSRRLGSAALDALLVGLGAVGPPAQPSRLVLEIHDSRSDPETARRAVLKAAARPEVLAVLGPFELREASAAAEAARATRLPVIPITLGPELGRGGSVLRAFSSNRLEAEALATAAQSSGLRRVAILRPQHAYGEVLGREFRAAWQAQGGAIVGEVTYATDLEGLEPALARLRALGAFDALLLPDAAERVGLIAPYLAAAGLRSVAWGQAPVSVSEGERPLQLLGTSAWYQPDLATRAGRYLDGALLALSFAREDPRPEVQRWVAGFQAAAGRPPEAMDAFTEDALRLLARCTDASTPCDRAGLLSLARDPGGARGVTTLESFDAAGEPRQGLTLLRLRAGGFVPAN